MRPRILVAIGWFLAPSILCAEDGTGSPPYQGEGTRLMVERLKNLTARADPADTPFLTLKRVPLYRRALTPRPPLPEYLELLPRYARELLNAGLTVDAVKAFEYIELFGQREAPEWLAQNELMLGTYKAMCQLRKGEQENCIVMHNIDSCLLPLKGGGIHRKPEGSLAAIGLLTNLLERFPDDLRARWLLNIAVMTVGQYPDGVPTQWRIPPDCFRSDYNLPRFTNVAAQVGLDLNELAGGSVLEDFDNDGFLDVMVTSMGIADPMHVFRNNGDGTFTDRTEAAGLTGETGGLNLVQADYNNDGFVDVFVLRGAWFGKAGRWPNSLLRNNGNGTFDDVTDAAGILSFHPTQTAVWLDYNGDGWIDLFIGNETTRGSYHPCELFRNNADGTFTEIAAAAGVAVAAFVKGVAAGDFDNDGRPDLYLSIRDAPNRLFHNDGAAVPAGGPKAVWRFTDVTSKAGVAEPVDSFPTWFFDYNNDGWLDLFVSGYLTRDVGDVAADVLGLPHNAARARLYRNRGDGTFEDVTRAANLFRVLHAMGCNFGDFDNDGFLDFYLGTGDPDLTTLIPNRAFRNDAGRAFQDVTTSAGLGHLQKGHGVSFGDVDNDGDQDIHADMGGAYSGDLAHNVLFENPGNSNRWVTLLIQGVRSNRSAIGARIQVTVDEPAGRRLIYKTVGSGGSFGASPLRQEIGLGQATNIAAVKVWWPASGQTQAVTGVKLDGFFRVREDVSAAEALTVPRLRLGGHNVASAEP